MSGGKRLWVRLAIYLPIIGALIAWQYWRSLPSDEVAPERDARQADTPAAPDAGGFEHRVATAEEWDLSIEELGARKLAKLQPWLGINGWNQVAGELVWWHDGEQPRVAYLAAEGERPEVAGPALFVAIERNRAVLYGDPRFRANLGEWSPSYALPLGWTVLRPPGSSEP